MMITVNKSIILKQLCDNLDNFVIKGGRFEYDTDETYQRRNDMERYILMGQVDMAFHCSMIGFENWTKLNDWLIYKENDKILRWTHEMHKYLRGELG